MKVLISKLTLVSLYAPATFVRTDSRMLLICWKQETMNKKFNSTCKSPQISEKPSGQICNSGPCKETEKFCKPLKKYLRRRWSLDPQGERGQAHKECFQQHDLIYLMGECSIWWASVPMKKVQYAWNKLEWRYMCGALTSKVYSHIRSVWGIYNLYYSSRYYPICIVTVLQWSESEGWVLLSVITTNDLYEYYSQEWNMEDLSTRMESWGHG